MYVGAAVLLHRFGDDDIATRGRDSPVETIIEEEERKMDEKWMGDTKRVSIEVAGTPTRSEVYDGAVNRVTPSVQHHLRLNGVRRPPPPPSSVHPGCPRRSAIHVPCVENLGDCVEFEEKEK